MKAWLFRSTYDGGQITAVEKMVWGLALNEGGLASLRCL